MGASSSAISDTIDLNTYKQLAGDQFNQIIFDTHQVDGYISKSILLALQNATDLFASHNWGMDELGRDNHDRVVKICKKIQQKGLKVWVDAEEVKGDVVERMCKGIDGTNFILVFVTK